MFLMGLALVGCVLHHGKHKHWKNDCLDLSSFGESGLTLFVGVFILGATLLVIGAILCTLNY